MKTASPVSPQELRQRAEALFRESEALIPESTTPEGITQLLHELRVHQIELEMQNEELRCAQADLDASLARYFDLYDLAPAGYLTINSKNLIQKINLTATTMFGVARSVLVNGGVSRILPRENQHLFYEHLKQCVESGLPQMWEMPLKRLDGEQFWAHLQATPAQGGECWITLSDISGLKQMESALQKANANLEQLVEERTTALKGERERLTSIIDGTKAGTWEWNVQTGETVFNEHWANIIGYTLDEISPVSIETWMKFAHPDDLQKCDELLEKHFQRELEHYENESRMKHKDGRWVWVLDRGKVASWSADGKPLWMFGTHQDISERKHAEEELQRAREAAVEANLAKSRFLAIVAHEFRTPLGLLTVSADLLDQYQNRISAADRQDQLEQIRSATCQITNLVDSVTTFTRQERDVYTAAPVLLDIEPFCTTIFNEVQKVWSNGHFFNAAISSDCGTRLLDETLFRRILENLLTNAFRFTPPGGRVSLSVKRQTDRLLIEVTDSGIGIPKVDQERIFEAFYRSSNVDARRGLGLGLAIANEAAVLMNASITLTSTIGEGSVFRVELPRNNNFAVDEQQP